MVEELEQFAAQLAIAGAIQFGQIASALHQGCRVLQLAELHRERVLHQRQLHHHFFKRLHRRTGDHQSRQGHG